MTTNDIRYRPISDIAKLPPLPVFLYAVVALWAVTYLLCWPLTAADTDLWYHLTAGREIVQHHVIPRDSFFSFLTPPRLFVDYYWLFQVLVYALHAAGGYVALIGLRAGVFALLALLIGAIAFQPRDVGSRAWSSYAAISCLLILLLRCTMVRPHLATYVCIAAFLWIIECRPRRLWVLPLLGVVWVNMHGISYPVLWLIAGSYGLEALLRRRWMAAAWLALTASTVLATPHGLGLLKVPWQFVSAAAPGWIGEFSRLTTLELFSWHVVMLAPSWRTIWSVFFLAGLAAAITGLIQRRLRLSHALLYAGGVLLATQGVRFTHECALLSLPLLCANPPIPPHALGRALPRPAYLAGLVLVALLPLRVLADITASPRPAYPLAAERLPRGTTAFLRSLDAGGNVLNDPNWGGYVQWMLYPRYRIFMDMQLPFLFTDDDAFLASRVFDDQATLDGFLAAYHPAFLLVPIDHAEAPALFERTAYRPIAFDDEAVLYVDAEAHPALAERHALRHLKPFALESDDGPPEASGLKKLGEGDERVAALQELRPLLLIDPDGRWPNQLLAEAYLEEQAYDRALPFARALMRVHPDRSIGFRLAAEAYAGLGAAGQALALYAQALERTDAPIRAISRAMGSLYLEAGQPKRAYKLLKHSIELFSSETPTDHLTDLADAAEASGHAAQARQIRAWVERTHAP